MDRPILTGTFTAKDEQGRLRKLHVYQSFHEDGRGKWVRGVPHLRTGSGKHVRRLAKGKYFIEETAETLRSDDPAAR